MLDLIVSRLEDHGTVYTCVKKGRRTIRRRSIIVFESHSCRFIFQGSNNRRIIIERELVTSHNKEAQGSIRKQKDIGESEAYFLPESNFIKKFGTF